MIGAQAAADEDRREDEDVGNGGLNYVHDYGLIHKWGLTPQELMMTT